MQGHIQSTLWTGLRKASPAVFLRRNHLAEVIGPRCEGPAAARSRAETEIDVKTARKTENQEACATRSARPEQSRRQPNCASTPGMATPDWSRVLESFKNILQE